MRKFILSLLLVFGCLNLSANDLVSLFQEHYQNHYAAGECDSNIKNFVAEAQEQNLNLENAYQIKIEKVAICSFFCYFNPKNPRGDVWRWYYHVIFIKDHTVYDMDYADNFGIVAANEYLTKMYDSVELESIEIQQLLDLENDRYLVLENAEDLDLRPYNQKLKLKDFIHSLAKKDE